MFFIGYLSDSHTSCLLILLKRFSNSIKFYDFDGNSKIGWDTKVKNWDGYYRRLIEQHKNNIKLCLNSLFFVPITKTILKRKTCFAIYCRIPNIFFPVSFQWICYTAFNSFVKNFGSLPDNSAKVFTTLFCRSIYVLLRDLSFST